MTLLLFDGLYEAATYVRPEWDGLFISAQTGRDGSATGSGGLGNTIRALTLPSAAPTCIAGFGIFVNHSSVLGGEQQAPLFFFRGGTAEMVIRINASGFIEARRTSHTGTLIATSSGHAPIAVGSWYHLAVKVVLGASSTGSVVVRLNDVQVMSATSVTTAGTSGSVDQIKVTNVSTTGSTNNRIWWDDMYICDATDATATQGRAYNDFLGDLKVAALLPSGDGDSSQWTPSTGTNHAALVDESPPNTTDYVSSGTSGQLDLYTLPDLPSTVATVYAIQLAILATATDAGSVSYKPTVKENSTVSEQTAVPLTGITWATRWAALLAKRPSDSSLWSVSDVNGLQAGVKIA